MKRIFYPLHALCSYRSVLFLFTFLLISGIVGNSQSYTINFTNGGPPAVGDFDANRQDIDGGTGFPIPIEVGTKFRVSQIGTIDALRYYKGSSHLPNTHIGNLWLSDGTLLATANFTDVGNGWQEVTLGTPVNVSPGNVYVVSVYSDDGWYAVTNNYFTTPVGTNPLIALCDCDVTSPNNGIYLYTVGSSFPTNTSGLSPNYWVDVRFTPTFPLPVSLVDLKATNISKDNIISWKTSSENNNKGFEVQRSNNGADWYTIGFVDGAGESTTLKSYSYTDRTLAPGLYYYRLNQQDFDGKSKLSTVVTANVGGKGKVSLDYPNPFRGTADIRFDLPKPQKVRLSVVDMSGREVKVLADKLGQAGSHRVSLSTDGLGHQQIYIIRLQTESSILTRKMLVQ